MWTTGKSGDSVVTSVVRREGDRLRRDAGIVRLKPVPSGPSGKEGPTLVRSWGRS